MNYLLSPHSCLKTALIGEVVALALEVPSEKGDQEKRV